MGLGDQPDLGDKRWKCAKCGIVSGMYGHPNGCPPYKVEPECDYRGALGSCHSLYCPKHGIPSPAIDWKAEEVKHWKEAHKAVFDCYEKLVADYTVIKDALDLCETRMKALYSALDRMDGVAQYIRPHGYVEMFKEVEAAMAQAHESTCPASRIRGKNDFRGPPKCNCGLEK
jgi:hypothetical protein